MQNYNHFPYQGVVGSDLWSSFIDKSDGSIYDDYTASLYSILPPNGLSHQFSLMPNTTPPIIVDYSPQHSLDYTPFQDLIDRRNWYLSNLRHNNKEAESFRQDITLQMANSELNRQLTLLQQEADSVSCLKNYAGTSSSSSMRSVMDSFRRMRIGDKPTTAGKKRAVRRVEKEVPVKKTEGDRVKLPKSISVRCNGHTKAVQGGDGPIGRVCAVGRVKTPPNTQKVCIHKTEGDEPVELEVYNQGITKTELCNKWQKTGDCPYGDRCQFAHGIEELRPVLRHRLYKTEVCRMILAGDPCPYRHRCHFRHSFTDKEEACMTHNKKSLNL